MSLSYNEISLSCEEFIKLTQTTPSYNLFPLVLTLDADLETAVSTFLKVETGSGSFLLESIRQGEYQTQYSYIGTKPYKTLIQNDKDPLIEIEQELSQYSLFPISSLPQLTGGAVGYISYDCVHYFETKVPMASKNTLGLPESIFSFYRELIVYDHVKHSIHLISHIYIENDEIRSNTNILSNLYNESINLINQYLLKLAQPLPVQSLTAVNAFQQTIKNNEQLNGNITQNNHVSRDANAEETNNSIKEHLSTNHTASSNTSNHQSTATTSTLVSNIGQSGYEKFVKSIKEHILDGDIIQAVPSQRCHRPLPKNTSAFDIYRHLRIINPSPYMFYLDFEQFQIVGASPEQLVKVSNNIITTHPIAGTRRRGKTNEEDIELEKELLSCEKERAEHIMLVDLGRNDIGRVSIPGTVKVDSLMHIERYSHVMHIVSHVSGKLLPNKTIYDAFRSVFPAGTVSGAPKIRAMQLINELEQDKRGVYAGAVGYIGFNGLLDTAIAIRTLVVKDGKAYLQAGGGIVFDSNPTDEHEETINKMKALAVTLDKAQQTSNFKTTNW